MGWLEDKLDQGRRWFGRFGIVAVVAGLLVAFFDWWQRIEFAVEHRQGIFQIIARIGNLVFTPWFGWGLAGIGATLLIFLYRRSEGRKGSLSDSIEVTITKGSREEPTTTPPPRSRTIAGLKGKGIRIQDVRSQADEVISDMEAEDADIKDIDHRPGRSNDEPPDQR
jgi:hypothetical protein